MPRAIRPVTHAGEQRRRNAQPARRRRDREVVHEAMRGARGQRLQRRMQGRRAGADGILTYFALDAARWLKAGA